MDTPINYRFQTYLKKQDLKRKRAMADQDFKSYYKLCNRLGISPEDEILYEQGRLEATLTK